MRPHEAFKLGFLARCVEEGLSPDQTHALAKQAADCCTKQAFLDFLNNPAKATVDTGKSTLDLVKGSLPLLGLAAAAPPVAGALTAYLTNSATDVDDAAAVEDVKKQELIDNYKRMAEQLNRQRQLRDYKQQRKRSGRVFL